MSNDLYPHVLSFRYPSSYRPVFLSDLFKKMQDGELTLPKDTEGTELSVPAMSRMVERVLLDHPIPPLLMNGSTGRWTPRSSSILFLKAVVAFDENRFRLTGLKFLTKLEGKYRYEVGPGVYSLFLNQQVWAAWSVGLDRPDIAESKTKGGYTS